MAWNALRETIKPTTNNAPSLKPVTAVTMKKQKQLTAAAKLLNFKHTRTGPLGLGGGVGR